MKTFCNACKKYLEVDRCHIKSKGSGGDMSEENILLMCREHHNEQHKSGWFKFANKYPEVLKELENKGWKFEFIFGVWKLVKQ